MKLTKEKTCLAEKHVSFSPETANRRIR